jgi:uncharacterized membrane protein
VGRSDSFLNALGVKNARVLLEDTMHFSPILIIHIATGTIGFLSGAAAASFRKGSPRHALAGNVFVISMLTMAASGTLMAILKAQPGNILGGTFTFYLVATAWLTARRRDGGPRAIDWAALVLALTILGVEATLGFSALRSPTGLKYGYSATPYFFISSIALLAVIGDVRMLVRRGISGMHRILRHLWRMCFAWFIAAISIFLARQHLFPAVLRRTGALYFLSFFPLVLIIFWLARLRLTNAHKRRSMHRPAEVYSLPS